MPTRTLDAQIIHTGKDASLHFPNERWVYNELKNAFKDGDRVTVTIASRKKKRSLPQNAVLHWYIQEIADETGMDKDVIKDVLKHKFLSVDIRDANGEIMADTSSGEVLKRVRSTTELSTIEFMEFTEQIRLWALDFLNLNLPLPDQQANIKFNN
jgi:hypothetical protein